MFKIVIDDASREGFRHVADAREYLLKLGQCEVDAAAHERLASATSLAEGASVEIPWQDLDNQRGKCGSHIIAPCLHDHPCPLASHLSPSAAKSPIRQSSASSVCCAFSKHCHETYFSSPLLTLIPGPQRPISTFESSLIFQFDFNSTSIQVWTFETVKTSLITLLPVAVRPVGSPHSPHPGESETTTHICTPTVQKCNTPINRSTDRSDDITADLAHSW